MSVEETLEELGIILPEPVAAVANYVPYVQSGNLVSISGQLPFKNGAVTCTGKVGGDVCVEEATEAAKLCAINLVAQIKAACGGDLERLTRVVKLGVFVTSADHFAGQPAVANGASDLMVAIFGERGRHSRSAVGVYALPLGAAVEIDALVEVAPEA